MIESPKLGRAAPAGLALVTLAVAFYLAVTQVQPPAAVPASAPEDVFSSARAVEHLERIARAPRPTGTAENEAARAYIEGRLRGLGFEVQEQSATVVHDALRGRDLLVGASLRNVAARLPGSDNTGAVMLMTHHDSVPTSPGAGDAGSGVATLLETARALSSGPRLRNDLILLFTDAEELGLLGARGFVREHPWAGEIRLVLNFEARGTRGPSFMFETSPGNGTWIRGLAEAAPHPVAASFLYDIYKRLPNDTDLTVFREGGYAGLNFGFVGNWPGYHTNGDSVENLDPRSLQHQGSYALALARHFGNTDLSTDSEEGDAVFFNLVGFLLHYPDAGTGSLAAAAIILFAGVLLWGIRTGALTLRGVARGVWIFPAAALASASVAQLSWSALRGTRLASTLPYGMAYNSELYSAACLALAVAVPALLYAWLRPRVAWADLAAGSLLWWGLLTLLTGLYSRGASYLFVWPFLLATLALGYRVLSARSWSPARILWVWMLPSLAAILLFFPVPYLLVASLSTSGLIPLSVATALLVAILQPVAHAVTVRSRWWLAGAALATAVVLAITAMATSGYDAERPRATSLFYHLDADTREALFVTADAEPNAWTSQFLQGEVERRNIGEFLPRDAPALSSQAPVAPVDPPALSLLEDGTVGDFRILSFHVRSPRLARALWVQASGCRILGASVNGRTVAAPRGGDSEWQLYYVGVPAEGIRLALVVGRGEFPVFTVVDQSDGLPVFPGRSYPPRPAELMGSPRFPFDTATLVRKGYTEVDFRRP